uniref:Mediator of RNA polymerase II transcription subunit 18 n=1 Tax=Romanomermis culicivorax TaxID=13658 RepID=A0A915KDH7_ROMCU
MSGGATHEYILQGSVIDSNVENLIQRIKGLADPKCETFLEHEMVFALKPMGSNPVQLHCRFDVNSDVNNRVHHLRYVGNIEPESSALMPAPSSTPGGAPMPVICRKVIESFVRTNDMMHFFRLTGFRFEYEFVAEGTIFTKGHLKITVTKISRLEKTGHSSTAQKMTGSHFVEMTAMGPSGDHNLAKSMRDFADQLSSVVKLEKVDYTPLIGQV